MSGRARSNGMNSRRIASGETIHFVVLAINLGILNGWIQRRQGRHTIQFSGWWIPMFYSINKSTILIILLTVNKNIKLRRWMYRQTIINGNDFRAYSNSHKVTMKHQSVSLSFLYYWFKSHARPFSRGFVEPWNVTWMFHQSLVLCHACRKSNIASPFSTEIFLFSGPKVVISIRAASPQTCLIEKRLKSAQPQRKQQT